MLVVAEAQDTVTADTGTVGQLPKPAEPACTVKLQFPVFPLRFCQLTDALALPGATGAKSGLVALKVTVAGLMPRLKSPAAGRARMVRGLPWNVGGSGEIGRPAAANIAAIDNHAPIGSQAALMVKVAVAA